MRVGGMLLSAVSVALCLASICVAQPDASGGEIQNALVGSDIQAGLANYKSAQSDFERLRAALSVWGLAQAAGEQSPNQKADALLDKVKGIGGNFHSTIIAYEKSLTEKDIDRITEVDPKSVYRAAHMFGMVFIERMPTLCTKEDYDKLVKVEKPKSLAKTLTSVWVLNSAENDQFMPSYYKAALALAKEKQAPKDVITWYEGLSAFKSSPDMSERANKERARLTKILQALGSTEGAVSYQHRLRDASPLCAGVLNFNSRNFIATDLTRLKADTLLPKVSRCYVKKPSLVFELSQDVLEQCGEAVSADDLTDGWGVPLTLRGTKQAPILTSRGADRIESGDDIEIAETRFTDSKE